MSLRWAWAFLTRLPGGAHPGDDRELGRSVPWFPIVGAILGALSGTVYWALHGPLGAPLAAVLAVAASAAATGGLHEDGLADTADALGGATRERRLEIMKDSRVGVFGAMALVLSTLARVFAVSSLGPVSSSQRRTASRVAVAPMRTHPSPVDVIASSPRDCRSTASKSDGSRSALSVVPPPRATRSGALIRSSASSRDAGR